MHQTTFNHCVLLAMQNGCTTMRANANNSTPIDMRNICNHPTTADIVNYGYTFNPNGNTISFQGFIKYHCN